MKKRLIIIICLFILIVSGCESNTTEEKQKDKYDIDISLQEGSITVECKKVVQDDEAVKKTAIETAYYSKEQSLISRKVKTIEQYKSEEEYKKALKSYSTVNHEDKENIKYKSKAYDEENTFVWITAQIGKSKSYKATNESLTARYYLIVHEGDGYNCKIDGATREEIIKNNKGDK